MYFSHIRAILKKKWQPSFLGSDISCEVHWQVSSSSSLRRQTEYSLRAALEAARWFRCQCLWFHVQRLPCATGLVKGLDCVSVLLEPPPGCPVPLPRPAGDPFSSQTHWPILLPFFCLPLSLRLPPSPAAAKLFISGSPLKRRDRRFEFEDFIEVSVLALDLSAISVALDWLAFKIWNVKLKNILAM